jgi:hypothetical protein
MNSAANDDNNVWNNSLIYELQKSFSAAYEGSSVLWVLFPEVLVSLSD